MVQEKVHVARQAEQVKREEAAAAAEKRAAAAALMRQVSLAPAQYLLNVTLFGLGYRLYCSCTLLKLRGIPSSLLRHCTVLMSAEHPGLSKSVKP